MKTIPALLAGLALMFGAGTALADPGHDHGHDRGRGHGRHDSRHDYRHDDRGHWHGSREVRYYGPPPRYHHPHRWARGERYYGPTYVVRDYGYYRLRPPPHGYHWVRDDRNYLLVSLGSGVILDMAFR
ncbi:MULTISPECIES: RcnB family protein [Dyella]|uniref:Transmembrane signal peptide protein n=2 Tax=Dyella TaxID=231454 RepID=A0A4R0YKL0_9GAMM|nr:MULTISPECIES: RcnB family protein [Dyella]TBR36344.1 transmembrane signal peptide protein [Dyella terrae]TCI06001.1 transmembrane signal peptide protein [Dyella soli]